MNQHLSKNLINLYPEILQSRLFLTQILIQKNKLQSIDRENLKKIMIKMVLENKETEEIHMKVKKLKK